MVNVYQSMLTTLLLQQLLVQAGFRQQADVACFHAGPIHVRLLDAPRLLIRSPRGTQYVAVLSADHLRHLLTALGQPLASVPPQAKLAA